MTTTYLQVSEMRMAFLGHSSTPGPISAYKRLTIDQ